MCVPGAHVCLKVDRLRERRVVRPPVGAASHDAVFSCRRGVMRVVGHDRAPFDRVCCVVSNVAAPPLLLLLLLLLLLSITVLRTHDAPSRPTLKKGKVFPYSLPSVGPGADPGVQAVSPQVT